MLISVGESPKNSEESAEEFSCTEELMLKGGRMAWSLHCSDSKGSLPWQSNVLSTGTLGTSKPSKGASVKQVYSYSLWLKGDARTEGNLDVVQRVHECSCSFLFFFYLGEWYAKFKTNQN